MKSIFVMLLLSIFTGCASHSSSRAPEKPELQSVPYVDLTRYMGDWHVIANIPYFAEKGKVATTERYEMRPDGKIANTFLFRKKSLSAPEDEWHAVATVVNKNTNAEWRVQFFWPVKLAYLVIDLDPDYRWAVVGHPSRNYLWVFSRERHLDTDIYLGILKRAAEQGYDTTKVTKVLQPR